MSKDKTKKLADMSEKDFSVYRAKRNLRSYWQKLSHDDWATFCKDLGDWLTKNGADEWDKYVKANNERKAKSDAEAEVNRPFPRKPKRHGHTEKAG